MQATELRIGNKLDYYGQTVQVIEITKHSATFGYFDDSLGFTRLYGEKDFPKPIPITEEWLERLGFVKFELAYIWYSITFKYPYDHFEISLRPSFDRYYVRIGTITTTEIKHVYQLQNLYFALTGEELTLKEK